MKDEKVQLILMCPQGGARLFTARKEHKKKKITFLTDCGSIKLAVQIQYFVR